jgi:hypothetical protein
MALLFLVILILLLQNYRKNWSYQNKFSPNFIGQYWYKIVIFV